jgi:hypothetical protein
MLLTCHTPAITYIMKKAQMTSRKGPNTPLEGCGGDSEACPNQNCYPISDGCSRRMFLGQTEYKERRLLRKSQSIDSLKPYAPDSEGCRRRKRRREVEQFKDEIHRTQKKVN